MLHSINQEQRLYTIKEGEGYTCLGFDVADHYINTLSKELNQGLEGIYQKGTHEHYYIYLHLVNLAKDKNKETGFRSKAGLNPKLEGLEGKRIECTLYGERTRFIVGRSTGWVPIHLEVKTRRSSGGGGLPYEPDKIQDIRILG